MIVIFLVQPLLSLTISIIQDVQIRLNGMEFGYIFPLVMKKWSILKSRNTNEYSRNLIGSNNICNPCSVLLIIEQTIDSGSRQLPNYQL